MAALGVEVDVDITQLYLADQEHLYIRDPLTGDFEELGKVLIQMDLGLVNI